MNLEKLVAVSGRPGIYRLKVNRPNGLILDDLDTGKSFFVSGRMHQFTPLESISIYTESEEDTVELKQVFSIMLEQLESNPPLPSKASSLDFRNYFESILPDHDRDKVLISDIKKIIKWFNFLNSRELLSLEDDVPETEESASEEVVESAIEEKQED